MQPEYHTEDSTEQTVYGQLWFAAVLTASVLVVEVVGGVLSGSLALLSDAAHVFLDIFSIGLTIFAIRLSRRPPSHSRTYGWHRAEVMAAMLNGLTLFGVAVGIIYHAIERFSSPPVIRWGIMLPAGGVGLLANLVVALRLTHYKEHSLNVRSAFLHVMSDLFGSVAVMVAAVVISLTGSRFLWIDPALASLIAVLIFHGAFRLVNESFHILLEGVPPNLKVNEVAQTIRTVPGVKEVHHLHIWGLCSQVVALSCHIVKDESMPPDSLITDINRHLQEKHGITDTTIQIDQEAQEGERLIEPLKHPPGAADHHEHDH